MKKIVALLILMVVGTCLLAESGFGYSVDFVSRYIWRGWDLTPNNKPAVQPSLAYTIGAFEIGVFSSFALVNRDVLKKADEFDIVFSYTGRVGRGINYSLGFTYYTFPNVDNFSIKNGTSPEPFVEVSISDMMFSPGVSIFYDMNLGDGLYILFEGGHSFEVLSREVDFGISCGYNNGQWGATPGISDVVLSIGTQFDLSFGSVSPSLNIAIIPNKSINDEMEEIWFGLSFSP